MTSPFNQPAALRVLITGAAGNIGRVLRAQLKFEAARSQGVRRLVFASSNHAVGCF